jgi:hypothetical protein
MAATNSLPFDEQDLRPNARGLRERLKDLWGKSRGPRAQAVTALLHEGESTESSAERSALTITGSDEFRIEMRGMQAGWRVSSIDQATGIRHEFYVESGVIYHVDVYDHPTKFLVGRPVQRIMDTERQAILEAVS